MFDCILKNKPPSIRDALRENHTGWHARSCAALIGAATLMSSRCPGRPARRRRHNSSRRRSPTSSSSWATTSAGCSRASIIAA